MFSSRQEIKVELETMESSNLDSTVQSSISSSVPNSNAQHNIRTLPSWLNSKNTQLKVRNDTIKLPLDVKDVKQEAELYTNETPSPSCSNVVIKKEFDFCDDEITVHDNFHAEEKPEILNEIMKEQGGSCADSTENFSSKSNDTKRLDSPLNVTNFFFKQEPAILSEINDGLNADSTNMLPESNDAEGFGNPEKTNNWLLKQEPGVSSETTKNKNKSDANSTSNMLRVTENSGSFNNLIKTEPVEAHDSATGNVVSPRYQNSTSSSHPNSYNSTTSAITSLRPACRYGNQCYRRNTQHKRDFSHPGDVDFIAGINADSSTDNSTRQKPVCWYGSRCYRKNETHMQQFYHPARSQTSTGRATTNGNRPSHGSDNSDEYESSFIDDSSLDDIEMSESESEQSFSDFEEQSSSEDEDKPNKRWSKRKKKNTFSLL